MALFQLLLLLLASPVALNAAAVNEFRSTQEESNILEVMTSTGEKGPALHIPPFLLETYKQISDTAEAADAVPKMVGLPGKKFGKRFRFNIPDEFRQVSQHQVTLFIFLPACQTIILSVYDVKTDKKLYSSPLACNGSRWTSVKFDESAQIVGEIRVQIAGADIEKEPWLVSRARSTVTPPRSRRSLSPDPKKGELPGDCAKVDKIFTPANYSWSNWLHPKVINLYQCRGSCPVARVQALGTNHALMMTALGSGDEQMCCVPTKWSSAYVLYRYKDTIRAVNFPNMVVQECGCSF